MTPEEFREHAHRAVDWMADYLAEVGRRRIVPEVAPGAIARALPDAPPEHGEPFERLFGDFERLIVPGMTHWNHPGWFAYFAANNSPPSILGEMLASAIGAQCMSWQTSPAATELEQVTMRWLARMLALPDGFTGVIQDTGSTSTLVALICARERAAPRAGGSAAGLRVYGSAEAHSSVPKGVRLAGYGPDGYRTIPTDRCYAMRPDALANALAADRAAGYLPACVVATIGTTSSTAIDPLRAIGEICRAQDVWLHVDAAWAGSAAIVPELRWMLDGIEHADSMFFNPHKWLLTNFDCSAYFVRDVDALLHAFAVTPEYLRTAHDAEVVNYRDWGIQLGRRFRALKLWFVLRSYGVEGLREMIRGHVALAREFAGWVAAEPDFELLAPAPVGLVCFRHRPAAVAADERALEAHNRALLARVNASGRVFLTHTSLDGRFTIRLAVGQRCTGREHVEEAWRLVKEAAGVV
ncbi:MAG TPA: pyridoxal-dependent decarboxylase [Gemmatimonadales bacterium]|nr:pyridoxal-dependent decarboxylase [Gemmatimonadales bacterium]